MIGFHDQLFRNCNCISAFECILFKLREYITFKWFFIEKLRNVALTITLVFHLYPAGTKRCKMKDNCHENDNTSETIRHTLPHSRSCPNYKHIKRTFCSILWATSSAGKGFTNFLWL